jgi:hypothetical protein
MCGVQAAPRGDLDTRAAVMKPLTAFIGDEHKTKKCRELV